MLDELQIGLVDEVEDMVGATHHGDEARRLLEHLAQALLLALAPSFSPHLAGGFDDDGHDADRPAVRPHDRRIIEIEPGLMRPPFAIKRQFLVAIGERSTGEPDAHDIVVEIRDLFPALAHLGTEKRGMPRTGEFRIGIVIEHDAVLAPERDDRHRRLQDECDGGFQNLRPLRRNPQGGPRPVERRDQTGHFAAMRQKVEIGGCHAISRCHGAEALAAKIMVSEKVIRSII